MGWPCSTGGFTLKYQPRSVPDALQKSKPLLII
jgi:hypothetical protein